MAGAKVGDVKYFHESGAVFKVEVLDVQKREYGKTPGEEYGLRILEVIDTLANTEAPPSGLEFSVWRAEDAGGYAGWYLLDHP